MMNKWAVRLLVSLAFLVIGIGATIFNSTMAGAQGQGAAPVSIVNPLPLPIIGTATVAGAVNATQSGAWTVGISGTPTVALSPGSTVNLTSSTSNPLIVRDVDHTSMQAILFFPGTTVAPGQSINSPEIDIDGFQNVSVNVSTVQPNSNLIRDISFSNPFNAGYLVAYREPFAPLNHLFTTVPVHSQRILVSVMNNGSSSASISGFVYATR